MRDAFTLIELIVVMVILVTVMAVVMPQGAKMLNSYQRNITRLKQENNLSYHRALSFLELKEFNITVDSKIYHTTKKGLILIVKEANR